MHQIRQRSCLAWHSGARVRRERLHLAGTWTLITVACFLTWTAVVLLGA